MKEIMTVSIFLIIKIFPFPFPTSPINLIMKRNIIGTFKFVCLLTSRHKGGIFNFNAYNTWRIWLFSLISVSISTAVDIQIVEQCFRRPIIYSGEFHQPSLFMVLLRLGDCVLFIECSYTSYIYMNLGKWPSSILKNFHVWQFICLFYLLGVKYQHCRESRNVI